MHSFPFFLFLPLPSMLIDYFNEPCIAQPNRVRTCIHNCFKFLFHSDSSAEDVDFNFSEEPQRLPLEEAFGDEVSGDAVPAPAPLPQRAPAPVMEPDTDHMSAVQELVEALARPFTVSSSNNDLYH